MDELGRGGGCRAAKIVLLAQEDRQPTAGGIAGDTAAVDAAADDGDVVADAGHDTPLRHQPCRRSERMRSRLLWQVARLDATHQHENEDHDEDNADNAGRTVTPTAGIPPRRNGTDQQQDQNDDEDCSKRHGLSST